MLESLFSVSSFLLVTIVVVLAVRVIFVYLQRPRYANYWKEGIEKAQAEDSLLIVALGDSIMQGIGASTPDKGLAGLIAAYVEDQTGKLVSLRNYSKTGGRVKDVLEDQLPIAPLDAADLIVVSVSANDSVRRTPVDDYRERLDKILQALPPEKTIVAEVAGVGARDKYQPIMEELTHKYGIKTAKMVEAFADAGNAVNVVAGDFFHPNNRGYQIWFSAYKKSLDELIVARNLKS